MNCRLPILVLTAYIIFHLSPIAAARCHSRVQVVVQYYHLSCQPPQKIWCRQLPSHYQLCQPPVHEEAPWPPAEEPEPRIEEPMRIPEPPPQPDLTRSFVLSQFEYIRPVGPWQNNSCSPYVAACLIESAGPRLTSSQTQFIQKQVDPDANGTPHTDLNSFLEPWFNLSSVSNPTYEQLFKHLHSRMPVLLSLPTGDYSYHSTLVAGYTTNSAGNIDSWILVDNGALESPMPHERFAQMWESGRASTYLVTTNGVAPDLPSRLEPISFDTVALKTSLSALAEETPATSPIPPSVQTNSISSASVDARSQEITHPLLCFCSSLVMVGCVVFLFYPSDALSRHAAKIRQLLA